MKNRTTAVFMLMLLSCANAPKKAEGECVCASDSLAESKITRLSIGTDKFVDMGFEPSHAGVFVGNPQILGATVAKAGTRVQLVFQPLKAGSTNVTVMDAKGEIKFQQQFEVSSVDLVDLSNQLLGLLKDTPGASVKLLKDKVVIDGELSAIASASRIFAITNNPTYSAHVLNLTRLSPQFFTALAASANDEIKKQFPGASVRMMNNQLWLEGKVETKEQSSKAEKIASLLLPEVLPGDPLTESPTAETLTSRPRVQNFLTVGK